MRRIFSLLLCLVMLVSMVPTGALATTIGGFESEDSTQPTVVETTEAAVEPTTEEVTVETTVEATEESVPETSVETQPEATEETVPETSEETVPETTEETVPETTEETVPETTEETEPEEGLFPGMPEDFTLSASQKADKKDLSAKGCVDTLSGLTEGTDYVSNQIMFWAGSEDEAQTIAEAYGAELLRYTLHIGVAELTDATVVEAVTAAADLDNNLPAVDPVYQVQLQPLPNEPYYNSKRDLSPYAVKTPEIQLWENFKDGDPLLSDPASNNYQWYHDMVNTYEAWGVTQGAGVTVAVLDTGVDDTHPDLEGKVEIITDFGEYYGLFASDLAGDHGTHVAGIIAATQGNDEGGAGVAPQANIMSINVFSDTDYFYGASFEMIAVAIQVAALSGADVINMSLGGVYTNYYSTVMQNALDVAYECGTSVFAAMGNEATNDMAMPACMDHVIAITAVNKDGYLADFSSYGTWADLAAPGQDIMSTIPYGDYANWDGTSMATPVAAGVAALYIGALGYNPGPDQVEAAMKKAVNKGYGSKQMGVGIVDAAKLFTSDTAKPMMGIFQMSLDDTTAILPQEQKDELFAGAVLSDGNYNAEIAIYDSFTLGIFPANDSANSQMLVYTVDGTNPAVKNGIVTNGIAVDVGGGGAGWGISLKKFPVGQKITVKAAFISGMGVMSKIATLSFKITEDVEIEGISIRGSQQLIAGKSATYTAIIEPEASANQKVTWKILDKEEAPGAKISSKGVLSTKRTDKGIITIEATSTVYPGVSTTLDVELINVKPIKTIAINPSSLTLGLRQGQENSGHGFAQLEVTKLINTANEDVLELVGSGYDVVWTTSNPKVATVDETGKVRATGLGKATITCTAADGSKKSAKCTVTVVTPPSEMEIVGQSAIGRGKKATYKVNIYPTSANKTVVWEFAEEQPAGVTLSSKGVLSVSKYASTGTVTIQATSITGTVVATKVITITNPTTYVRVVPAFENQGVSYTFNSSRNSLKTVNLYSADVPETEKNDQVFQLTAATSNNGPVTWTSSNASVASVDENGTVTAHKAGSATITCKADDGSGKKASFTVKVTTPASYITLKSNLTTQVGFQFAELLTADEYKHVFRDLDYVYMYNTIPGKSATNKVTLGDTYGKPSSAKVTWDYEMFQIEYHYDDEGYLESLGVKDRTSWSKQNKMVTLSSSGKLSVSKKMGDWDLRGYDWIVITYATIEYADHTVTGGLVYQIVDPTTFVEWDDLYLEVYDEETGETGLKWINAGKKVTLSAEQYMDEAFVATFDSDCLYLTNLSVSSSNPDVINLTNGVDYLEDRDDEGNLVDLIRYVEFVVNGKGTAKITVTANDGSGKSATLTVTVK